MKAHELIHEAVELAVKNTVRSLKKEGMIKNSRNAVSKTEELLFLYSNMPENHDEKKHIDTAMEVIDEDEYKDIIRSYYFDGMSQKELADIYGCQYQTIAYNRKRLIRKLAKELFLDDVVKEIKES